MKLTTAEKFVIGTNIFLFLVLLTLLGLQFAIDQSGIDVRQLFKPPSAATSAPIESLADKSDLTIKVPEPTAEEEIGAKPPRGAWVGWTVIIVSGLLTVGGISVKLLRG